ncbi:hypothetical protein CROQUDRAFT_725978 [Cronartium quercuum f. sp. fusiforme G11]|uniref:Uncharacterized protein n=1 Tax=Cronartium quercuum f. sp. fusiforme G11 TaxID=708437 RepID=A0A9P6N7J9_9BASI|nr:hypothetical protein CROQUDRAFT_725978 [Cronartium quercuum f. sp. fusiforme G11]
MRIFLLPLLACFCRLSSISSTILPTAGHVIQDSDVIKDSGVIKNSDVSKTVPFTDKYFSRSTSRGDDDTEAPKVVAIALKTFFDQDNKIHHEVFLTQVIKTPGGDVITQPKPLEFPRGHITKQETDQYGPVKSMGTIPEELGGSSDRHEKAALASLSDDKLSEEEGADTTNSQSAQSTGVADSPRDHFEKNLFRYQTSHKPIFQEASEIFQKQPDLVQILNQPVSEQHKEVLKQLVMKRFHKKPHLLAATMAVNREIYEEMGGRGIIRDIPPFSAVAKGKTFEKDGKTFVEPDRKLLGFIVDVPHNQELMATPEAQRRNGVWVPVDEVEGKLKRPEMITIWNGMKHHITGKIPLDKSQHINEGSLPSSQTLVESSHSA